MLETLELGRITAEDEAVAAERAFAIRVAYDGIRDGFLSVLAKDSVVAGDGPVPGRPLYEAMPKDQPGRLMWEPAVVAASSDGSLTFTTGPYRALDKDGQETSYGVYFSVWRRHPESGLLELVLDFGAQGADFPETEPDLLRLGGWKKTGGPLKGVLETATIPSLEGALRLGLPEDPVSWDPSGYFCATNGELGVLWGSRHRTDGTKGVFALVLASDEIEAVALASIEA